MKAQNGAEVAKWEPELFRLARRMLLLLTFDGSREMTGEGASAALAWCWGPDLCGDGDLECDPGDLDGPGWRCFAVSGCKWDSTTSVHAELFALRQCVDLLQRILAAMNW